jgi:hypothetical protein
MTSTGKALLAIVFGLLSLWIGWGAYVSTTTERVPYERLEGIDGVEIRQYPRTIQVETTAPDAGTAFRRLFRYIKGAHEADVDVAMTAPVRTRGETIAMTAPVQTATNEAEMTMAFFLPADYTPDSAPKPTDESVRLVVEPSRTVAASQFSWYATDARTDRHRRELLETLDSPGIVVLGDPMLLQYNDPWTPPFMRRNEVVVRIADESVQASFCEFSGHRRTGDSGKNCGRAS